MSELDKRTEEIEEEIRANFQMEEDSILRAAQEYRAACFRCAVLEQKLKIEQELNKENQIKWR